MDLNEPLHKVIGKTLTIPYRDDNIQTSIEARVTEVKFGPSGIEIVLEKNTGMDWYA